MATTNVEILLKARDDTKAALRSLNTALKDLDTNTKGVGKGLDTASKNVGGLTKSFSGMGGAIAALGIGAVVKGLFDMGNAAVTSAAALEKNLRNVRSLAPQAEASIQELSDAVIEMSKRVPQSVQELSLGLYDVRSSGFAGKAGLEILEIAAKGASAGLSTTATSVKGLTAIMNAYGLKTGPEATKVMDVMFQTVNRGVVTFDELAQNIGDVTSISALLKVPVEEVGAAFAVITRNGINAAETSTAIASILRSILNPSTEAAKLASKLGIEWNAQALKAKGLNGVLADMIDKTKGNEQEMATLAGDARALKAAFILAKDGGKEFNDELAIMQNSAGATDAALAEQAKSFEFQAKLLQNNIDAIKISLGNELLPVLTDFAKKLNEFINSEGFKAFITWLKENKDLVKGFAIVLGVVLIGVLAGLAAGFIAAHAAAFAFGAVLAAAVAQIMAVVWWMGKAKKIREAIEKWIIDGFKMLAEKIPEYLEKFKTVLVEAFTNAWNFVKETNQKAIAWVVDQITSIPEHLATAAGMIFGFFVRLFTEWIPKANQAIKDFVTSLPGKIATAAQQIWTAASIWFAQTATNIINWAINTKNAVVNWFQQLPGQIASMATNLWNSAVSGFNSFKESAINWAIETYNAVIAWFKNLPGAISGSIKSGATGLWSKIKEGAGNVASSFMGGMALAGARADGGPVSAGQSYLVGESGPELFTPSSSGMVTPNGGSMGGIVININGVSINNGMDVRTFARDLAQQINRARNGGF